MPSFAKFLSFLAKAIMLYYNVSNFRKPCAQNVEILGVNANKCSKNAGVKAFFCFHDPNGKIMKILCKKMKEIVMAGI